MIKTNFLTFLFCFISSFAFTLPTGNEYLNLIGKSATHPGLYELVQSLEKGQHKRTFDRNSNTYELNSYASGISLIFNQNFLLKEIHFYDSGFLYQSYKGKLPMNLNLGMHYTYFQENFKNFEADQINSFKYIGSFANGQALVYFKDKRSELIKIIGNPGYLEEQDVEEMQYWGMRLIPDGTCTGNCVSGSGTMKWSSSLTYNGSWDYGIPHGEGSMNDSLGLSYSGGFRLGFLWGESVLKLGNEYTYKGDFFMGKKFGQGEIRYGNGTKYTGQWLNDQMHGKGHYYFSNTYHYEGDFQNNQFNGRGILYTPEGYLDGGFKDGKPHGYGKQVANANQSTLSGKWVDGKKEGNFEAYNPLLGNYQVYFENDIEIRKMR